MTPRYDLICIGLAIMDSIIRGFDPEPVSATGYRAGTGSLNVGGDAVNEVMAAVAKLKKSDRELIHLIYFCEYTEQECSVLLGTTQQNINKKKKRILGNIYKLMEGRK